MVYKFTRSIQVDTGLENPANHLAHHHYLILFQEARQAYLDQFGYSERDIEGFGMFIVEVNCVYKKELFHQDRIDVKCKIDHMKNKVFSMSYVIERTGQVCAQGLTHSVCVDPVIGRSVPLPRAFVSAVSRYEGF